MTSVHSLYDTRIFYKECKTLVNNGFHITLIVPSSSSSSEIEGIRVLTVKKYHSRFMRFIITGFEIFHLALKEKAAVYHIHDPELLLWAQLMRFCGKTVIYDMHENLSGAITKKPWIHSALRPLSSKFFGRFERMLLYGLPVIFAEYSYQKYFPTIKRATTILNLPHSTELLSVETTNKFDEFTIGYIGGVSEVRGSLVILEAIQILNNQGYKVGFQCVGPIGEKHRRELDLKLNSKHFENIVFHGRLRQKEGLNIIGRCHVGIAVLQESPNYIESYPTKMFEYMTLRMPVIASDFPLYRDIVCKYHCGLCVNPSKPHQIANAISFLIQNPEEAQTMGHRGHHAVSNILNWSTEATKLIKFYQLILST